MAFDDGAYVIAANSHSAALFRQALQAAFSGTGVLTSTDFQVTQTSTPSMAVSVAAGRAIVPGTQGETAGMPANSGAQTTYGLPSSMTDQGVYFAYDDSGTTLSVAAASGSNPRIDLACLQIEDASYSGSGNTPALVIVTGTPAPSPVPPTVPASCIVRAQILVPTGATQITNADITNVAPTATAVGLADSGWLTSGGLVNGWANYGSGQSAWGYRRVGDMVRLRGGIYAGTSGTVFANLPAGFQPPSNMIFASGEAGNVGQGAIGIVGGACSAYFTGVPAFMSLDGITFLVD